MRPHPLRRFAPPEPPEDLKDRVLATARAAMRPSPPSRADRIFYSTRWRLAWGAALAALVLAEGIAVRSANDGARTPPPLSVREADAAAQALGLPHARLVGDGVVGAEPPTHGSLEDL